MLHPRGGRRRDGDAVLDAQAVADTVADDNPGVLVTVEVYDATELPTYCLALTDTEFPQGADMDVSCVDGISSGLWLAASDYSEEELCTATLGTLCASGCAWDYAADGFSASDTVGGAVCQKACCSTCRRRHRRRCLRVCARAATASGPRA